MAQVIPFWPSLLIATAFLGAVVFWLAYLYRHSWGTSWRAALVAVAIMAVLELVILGAARR